MTQMMNTTDAVFTLANLGDTEQPLPLAGQYLELIRLSRQELDALEAGMHNQSREARALQNELWSAQHAAQLDIVKAALADGVSAALIMNITHREVGV